MPHWNLSRRRFSANPSPTIRSCVPFLMAIRWLGTVRVVRRGAFLVPIDQKSQITAVTTEGRPGLVCGQRLARGRVTGRFVTSRSCVPSAQVYILPPSPAFLPTPVSFRRLLAPRVGAFPLQGKGSQPRLIWLWLALVRLRSSSSSITSLRRVGWWCRGIASHVGVVYPDPE